MANSTKAKKSQNLVNASENNPIEDNRKEFAKNLVENIKKNSDNFFKDENSSLIFSINGEWGEGKSTVKEEIIKNFKGNSDFKLIEYNDWYFSEKDNLFEGLFLELNNNFNLKNDINKCGLNIIKENKEYQRILEFKTFNNLNKIKNLFFEFGLGFFGYLVSFITITILLLIDLTELYYLFNINYELIITIATAIIALICGTYKTYQTLINKKDFIKPLIENGNKKYVIFIDDIDRLSKNEIVDLIRTIKTNLDIKNIIYILFYSKKIVAEAISENYFDGYNFL